MDQTEEFDRDNLIWQEQREHDEFELQQAEDHMAMVVEHVADAQHQGLPLEPGQLQDPPLEEEGKTPGPVQEVAAKRRRVQMLKKSGKGETPEGVSGDSRVVADL